MKYVNTKNISLPLAVWLAVDLYDGPTNSVSKTVSVTTLLKPIKETVLAPRVPAGESVADVSDQLANRLGTALHSAVEYAWLNKAKEGLVALGYNKNVIERIKINPDPADLTEDDIALWLELRTQKEIMGWTVSGSCDFIFDQAAHDFKSTTVFSYIKGNNDDSHIKQMSMYRWLNPEKITRPDAYIEYLFKDFSANKAKSDKNYPQNSIVQKKFQIMEPAETEQYIISRLTLLEQNMNAEQADMPDCTEEELWMDPPEYKYFSKPDAKRSTKNFGQDYYAAQQLLAEKGTGIVKTVQGKARKCNYCSAASICLQRQDLIAAGLID